MEKCSRPAKCNRGEKQRPCEAFIGIQKIFYNRLQNYKRFQSIYRITSFSVRFLKMKFTFGKTCSGSARCYGLPSATVNIDTINYRIKCRSDYSSVCQCFTEIIKVY